ncbi:MAG TPA: NAD(P)-dependent oxidoreductase [Polyangiaceae bacterium]|nr:NAD(P)-dependent oxidoreductase [Polyangiaceae bacterium]
MSARVVVTGATGHLGSYVTHMLAAAGQSVLALSRSGELPRPPFGSSRGEGAQVETAALDIARDVAVNELAPMLGPDTALVHLAAWHPPATASTGAADRRRLLEHNVLGMLRVLEAARRGRVHAVVYASSFEVYGLPQCLGPVSEAARLEPISDYGASKLAGEDHLLAFAYEEKTRVVALRLPAIYGPGETTLRALPNFLLQVARGERPCIQGTGEDLRDQLHVSDAALAVQCALAADGSGIFNVADGQPHSIRQLAQTALEVAEMPGAPDYAPAQKPRYDFHMSIAKARRELSFEPRISLLEGMREQLGWLRARAGA